MQQQAQAVPYEEYEEDNWGDSEVNQEESI